MFAFKSISGIFRPDEQRQLQYLRKVMIVVVRRAATALALAAVAVASFGSATSSAATADPDGVQAIAYADGTLKSRYWYEYNRWAANPAISPSITKASGDVPVIYPLGDHRGRSTIYPSTNVYGAGDVKVFIVGDSMAAQWYTPLARIGRDYGWKLYPRTRSATPFVFASKWSPSSDRQYSENVLKQVQAEKPDLVIMSTASPVSASAIRQSYWKLKSAGVRKTIIISDIPKPDKSETRAYKGIPNCLAEAKSLSKDARVYCAFGKYGTKDWDGDTSAALRDAASSTAMEYISMNRLINRPAAANHSTSPPVIGEAIVMRDRTHLTNTFAVSAQDQLEYQLAQVGAFDL